MNINKIIRIIALSEETAYSFWLMKFITPEIKEKFRIPQDAHPFVEGSQSVVFENSNGNIVAFLAGKEPCETAITSVGKNLKIFPEVYDIEIMQDPSTIFKPGICGIEMEKLRVLTEKEFNDINSSIRLDTYYLQQIKDLREITKDSDDPVLITEKMAELHPRWKFYLDRFKKDGFVYKLNKEINERQSPHLDNNMFDPLFELKTIMQQNDIEHSDLHPGNVAFGKDGKLKLIDFESIHFH